MKFSTRKKLAALKEGLELPIDPYAMAMRGDIGQVPPTDERAVLTLEAQS